MRYYVLFTLVNKPARVSHAFPSTHRLLHHPMLIPLSLSVQPLPKRDPFFLRLLPPVLAVLALTDVQLCNRVSASAEEREHVFVMSLQCKPTASKTHHSHMLRELRTISTSQVRALELPVSESVSAYVQHCIARYRYLPLPIRGIWCSSGFVVFL